MYSTPAVLVQDACKSYGKNIVFKNLNLSVAQGSIYGLLGASGCGKTTLLQSIIGLKKLDSGTIWVSGEKVGSKTSLVPGPCAGYMPQEIALIAEFTVKDAIYYFGRLLNVDKGILDERYRELSNLLNLPPGYRYIKQCSGGEQRRISFAVSLINQPQLLILDEPTVGVDSILRESIWNYLKESTEKHHMTVIVTTHYIEEAKYADKVGFMRKGQILAQQSPEKLIKNSHADSLEEAFLILSRQQDELEDSNIFSKTDVQLENIDWHLEEDNASWLPQNNDKRKIYKRSNFKWTRIKALMEKNCKQFYRNYVGAFLCLMFPIVQIALCLVAIGRDIKGIPIGIVNEELCMENNLSKTVLISKDGDCIFQDISCRFLTYLNVPSIEKEYYVSLDSGITAVKKGKVVGVLHMAENISKAIEEQFRSGPFVEGETYKFGQIKVWMDMSNRQIGAIIKAKVWSFVIDLQKDLYRECNLTSKLGEAPLKFEDPIYGEIDEEYVNFICPAVVLTFAFGLSTIISTPTIITERSEGIWERNKVTGVTFMEITVTHLLFQLVLAFIQMLEIVYVTFGIFGFECLGSVYLVAAMTYLQGIAGVVFGFWVSIVSINHTMCHLITTAVFFLSFAFCGMLWPLEGMPIVMQWVVKCLPFTISIEAVRNITRKGVNIFHNPIWISSGITAAWIAFFSMLSLFLLTRK